MAAVGYSGGVGAGPRAIEHLAQIAAEAEKVPVRTSVVIPHVTEAFDSLGALRNPVTEISLKILLDDLAWWTSALARTRDEGQLPPAAFRIQAAAAAAQELENEALPMRQK